MQSTSITYCITFGQPTQANGFSLAVRTSYLEEQENGTVKRKKRYLAYFAKKESALAYLADLNSGALLPEHQKYADIPTFAELYEKWKKYRCSLKNRPGASAWKNYGIAFNMYAPVHDRKIVNIRARDLQECITAHSSNWNTCMSRLGLNHAPHDCRYTFAALADNAGMNETCRKLIMGHALPNKAGTAFKTEGRNQKSPGNKAFPGLFHILSTRPVRAWHWQLSQILRCLRLPRNYLPYRNALRRHRCYDRYLP